MSEENTQNLEAEMLSTAQEALEGTGDSNEPVWAEDAVSAEVTEDSVEAASEGSDDAPPKEGEQDDLQTAPDEPQSDEKQEEEKPEEHMVPQSALQNAVKRERAKKREAFERVDQLESQNMELMEAAKLLQARVEQLSRIVREREAMDPAEHRMTEYEWKLQNVEAEKRVREQQQQLRAKAEEDRKVAEYRQQFMDEAAELEQELGIPAAFILARFPDAPPGTPMRAVAEDLQKDAYNRFKSKLAKERNQIVANAPEPISSPSHGRRDLTNYESDEELTNNMLLHLKRNAFIGS